MKRSTVIYQMIGNHNASDIVLHLHRLWLKNPKNCKYLLRKLSYEKVHRIERWLTQCFWWIYRDDDFMEFLANIIREKYPKP